MDAEFNPTDILLVFGSNIKKSRVLLCKKIEKILILK